MDFVKLKKAFGPYITPLNMVVVFLFLAGAIASFVVLLNKSQKQGLFESIFKKESVQERRIEIQDGEKRIVINENGLVEFSTPENVFYQTWNPEQVQKWFNFLEKKFQGSQFKGEAGESGYKIKITSGEKTQMISLSGANPDLTSLLKVFEEMGALGENFKDFFASPTPAPKTVSAEGSYTVPGLEQQPPDCTLWGQEVNAKAVISNTVCLKEGQE